jgi:DNA-binding response OmpR family regulator
VAKARVLVVDDDPAVSGTLARVLEMSGFEVAVAEAVPQALQLIVSQSFDALLTDLHMPHAGDGLTVVSAMRHLHPQAPTLLLTAYPAMDAAANAVLLQADEILVKPMGVSTIVEVIRDSLAGTPHPPRAMESVADILKRATGVTIEDWFDQVEVDPVLTQVTMSFDERCGHLPQFFREMEERLRTPGEPDAIKARSRFAAQHGIERKRKGYTAVMLVEESRILQACLFRTIRNNLRHVDFNTILDDVMTVADEVQGQLGQAMESYLADGNGRRAS